MNTFVRAAQRLTAIALMPGLAVGLCAAAGGPSPDRYAGLSLIEALERIQSLGLKLVYSSDLIRPGMRVDGEPASVDPREILNELLAPHRLEARQGPGSVLFIVKGGGRIPPPGRIEGAVRSRLDDEPIANAWILVEGAADGAISDVDGRFRLEGLQPDEYDLIVKVPGLEDERFDAVTVQEGLRTLITLHLVMTPQLSERIIVSSGPESSAEREPGAGTWLAGDDLRAAPSLGGDAQRAAGAQPGVASADRSAGVSVRGGEANEVLYRIDGQDLYDPFHLKSFHRASGIVDVNAVGDARFFSEAFPAEYGDRMSGVLDLASTIPASPGATTIISSSFVNSRFMTDGRFRAGDGHWLVSARGWYPDAVVDVLDRENEGFSPTYSDVLGVAQVQLSPGTLLTGHFLAARDGVDFVDPAAEERVDASSSTRYAWMTLESLWAPRLQSRTLFSYGTIESVREGSVVDDQFVASVDDRRDLAAIGFSQDWEFRQSQRMQVKWGLSAKNLESAYTYRSGSGTGTAPDDGAVPPAPDRATDLLISGRQYGLYAASQFSPTAALSIETGLRWDSQTYTGENQLSPRVSVEQSLPGSSRLRAAWGRYYQSQGVHELQIEDGVTGLWPAQRADHFIVGFEQESGGGLLWRADAYWKEMSHLRPRYENLFNPFELLPEFEPDRIEVAPGAARARGIDLTLAMIREGPFTWSASYSLSSIEDSIGGGWVVRSWDQPHAFRFDTHYRPGRNWEFDLAGEHHTGWPTTAISASAVRNPDGSIEFEAVPGPRNGARFPDYRRFDLRVARHVPLDRSRLTLFLEITNLLDRRNVCCVEGFAFEALPGGDAVATPEYGYWLRRVPSFGVTWRFDH